MMPENTLRQAFRRLKYQTRLALQGPARAGSLPMKHAGPAALDRLEPLLSRIRAVPGLVEKSRGVFYRRSRAFLHFHEDPSGLHADLRAADGAFERFRVEDADEQAAFLARLVSL